MKNNRESKNTKCISSVKISSKSLHKNCEELVKGDEDSSNACKEKKFQCSFENCAKTFRTGHRLKIHIQSHNNIKHFKCSICRKSFSEKGNLKTHLRIHTGERPFSCNFPYCDKTYKVKSHLIDHVNSKHLNYRPFQCNTCSKGFPRKSQLNAHLVTHNKLSKQSTNSNVDAFFNNHSPLHPHQDKNSKGSSNISIKDKRNDNIKEKATKFIESLYSKDLNQTFVEKINESNLNNLSLMEEVIINQNISIKMDILHNPSEDSSKSQVVSPSLSSIFNHMKEGDDFRLDFNLNFSAEENDVIDDILNDVFL